MNARIYARAALSALLLCAAGPAAAHTDPGLGGSFLAGFGHPLGGADHLLAMLAVGLWGAFLGRPLVVVLPLLFPAVMAAGGALGMAAVPLPPVELGIALSVLVLGGLIAGAVRAPAWLAVPVVAGFAIFHGYAHGLELPAAAEPWGYSIAFVLATGLLHLAGIALGWLMRGQRGRLALRAGGGLIALAGAWFLVVALPGAAGPGYAADHME